MKIAFVLDDTLDKPDGVQQYVKTVGAYLSAKGHEVHYITGESHLAQQRYVHPMSKNVKVRFNGNVLSVPLPASRRKVRRLLMEEKYDVLHIQMPYSPLMAHRVVAEAPPATAIVGTFHILPFGKLSSVATRALGLCLRRSLLKIHETCAVSEPASEFARQSFGIRPVVIPNAVDLAYMRSIKTKPQTKIVFLGRLVPRKGCLEFLRAVSLLPPDILDAYEFIVAGKGPELNRLRQYAAAKKLNITFLGFVEEAEKPVLFASAKLAVFPSVSGESFGIVLIEAMASGSGVVLGGNNPGYASVLSDTPESIIDPHDPRLFSRSIERFLRNATLFQEVHTKQQYTVKRFSIEEVGPTIEAMYGRAIAKVT